MISKMEQVDDRKRVTSLISSLFFKSKTLINEAIVGASLLEIDNKQQGDGGEKVNEIPSYVKGEGRLGSYGNDGHPRMQ